MSAFEIPVHKIGACTAGSDLSAKQFYAVDISGDEAVDIVATAGVGGLGILQNKPASGVSAEVQILGVSKAILGGTVVAGDKLTTDANGKLVKAYGADRVLATAIVGGVSGDIISVELTLGKPFAQHGPAVIGFKLTLASVADGTVAKWTPGFAGRIKKAFFVTDVPVTTGSKLSTLTPKIATVAPTGGVVALTSATCTPISAEVDGTTITAGNTFGATDEITIVASSTTTFVEGSGTLFLVLA